ncbi:MAG: DUF4397 domain-containing protein [Saprospiraceae bacterium]|jgi:hypothetical protein|nr:DUF4397 domain-containing protein [Saprospiraceae bacterium]
MKIHIKILYIFSIVFAITSCGDQYDYLASVESASNSAKLKVIHAAPDTTGIILKIDGTVVSGVNTASNATPGLVNFASYFPLSEYFTVEPGNKKLTVTFSSADLKTQADLNVDLKLDPNKFYSAYIIGTKPNYSVVYGVDDLSAKDPSKTHVRFVNTVSNTPSVGYEILVNNVVIDTKTTVTTGTDSFVALDQDGTQRFTIIVRQKGTTTALSTLSNVNFLRGKKYTLLIRGINGATSTAQKVTAQTFGNN